jgi:hypothetical protein
MISGFGTPALANTNVGFDSKGTAMVPVTAGNNKLGTIEISSPMDQVSEFFAGIDKSLINLVNFAKQSLGIEKKDAQRKKLDRGDTDDKKGGIGDTITALKDKLLGIVENVRSGFDKIEFGDKMKAVLLLGALLLFRKYRETLRPIVEKIVSMTLSLIKFLGGPKNSLMFLIGAILAVKLAPLVTLAVGLAKYLGGFIPSFKTLKNAFKAVRLFIGTTLPKQLVAAYRGTDNFLVKAFTKLGSAFKAMRLFMTATLVPTLMTMITSLGAAIAPILIPIAVIAAIAAGIAAVLFSMKSGIEAFKNSLESGDSMILAIGKGLLDFSATLITLPITLLKNLLGYIAGLLGFDGIKEAIDNFSFKDMIVNAFTSLIGGTIRLIKAIAKGAGAALAAAFPGGEGPGEAFSRVFKEVMSGGEGTMPDEKPEQGKGINRLDTSEMDIDIVSPNKIKSNVFETAQAATSSSESFNTTNYKFDNSKTVMANKIENIEQGKTTLEALKFKRDNESKAPIMVNNNRGGDTNVTNNTANVSGELQLHHTDKTSRLINSAIA